MHGANIKIISAQQATICNIYKNTKLKLLKTNAAIWFNKMCKIKQLKPNYIQFKTRGKTPQDRGVCNVILIYFNIDIITKSA